VPERARVPLAARIFFLATAVAAVVLVASAVDEVPGWDAWPWWLVALTVPVLYRFPVVITRGSRSIEIGFESFVVIFLAFAAPQYSLVLWAAGWLLAQVRLPWDRGNLRMSPWIWLYNTAMTTLGGAAVVLVVTRLVPHALEPGPWPLLAVGLAAGAYFAVDYILSALALPLLGRGGLRDGWTYDDLGVALSSSAGIAALGYLGSVALDQDAWAVPLVAVPVATFVFASRGFSRASMERGRVAALLAVASRLHHATTDREVEEIVLAEGPAALLAERLSLVDAVPGSTIHAPVDNGSNRRWLTPATRRSQTPYSQEDKRTLALLASMASDALGRLSLLDELEQLARLDPLTGLANRATLQSALALALAQRGDDATGILFCDLDGFKEINDQHGHDAGDQLLRLVADRMTTCVRDGDLVARIGGDEFVVLLPRTSHDAALDVAQRISAAIAAPTWLDARHTTIGVSIGAAVSTRSSSAESLLRRADGAMYLAKTSGPNQVRMASSQYVL
jgi:diguanylate cyclase (GGDEF)-like protein